MDSQLVKFMNELSLESNQWNEQNFHYTHTFSRSCSQNRCVGSFNTKSKINNNKSTKLSFNTKSKTLFSFYKFDNIWGDYLLCSTLADKWLFCSTLSIIFSRIRSKLKWWNKSIYLCVCVCGSFFSKIYYWLKHTHTHLRFTAQSA